MERLLQILGVIFIIIAAFFLWKDDTDALFISAVLGAVCFFLSIWVEVGKRVEERKGEAEKRRKGEERDV